MSYEYKQIKCAGCAINKAHNIIPTCGHIVCTECYCKIISIGNKRCPVCAMNYTISKKDINKYMYIAIVLIFMIEIILILTAIHRPF